MMSNISFVDWGENPDLKFWAIHAAIEIDNAQRGVSQSYENVQKIAELLDVSEQRRVGKKLLLDPKTANILKSSIKKESIVPPSLDQLLNESITIGRQLKDLTEELVFGDDPHTTYLRDFCVALSSAVSDYNFNIHRRFVA
ncbi:hypothetical protein GOV04_02640 [Candidatus Woesearchaeota archaeon]|nr:hypothetical protein [Candidatus Woesearchaeota archaeon]